jgi:hypothetical protein
MNFYFLPNGTRELISLSGLFLLAVLIPNLVSAQTQQVTVMVDTGGSSPNITPDFLGLSYESSMLLPQNGQYYFDPLGIKSLRVGANAVDAPGVSVPDEKDIDMLFDFARAAGVKVIYSFRLKNGDPTNSARLAAYIAAHYADTIDCYSIGNEPNFYLKTFDAYFAEWKPHYDAILKAVPDAKFDGASATGPYALDLVKAVFAEGHLTMASDHYYFLGSGRAGETNPPATRARFLSDNLHKGYEGDYEKVGAVLAAQGVPYRIDEMNSCYNGGAKNSSDTYASTLWALDCTHWWAAHHILGVNYHTGESVGRDGTFGAANYASFVHRADGAGFDMRPQAYALLAFSQGARGRPLEVKLHAAPGFNFDAYAYHDKDGSIYVTLINKSYDDGAEQASVSLKLRHGAHSGTWQRMDLVQENSDVAAKTGVKLGGASVDSQGTWAGQWSAIKDAKSSDLAIQLTPTSATILRFTPAQGGS